MTDITYTLVGYKPNSEDTCRGCTMATFESDFHFARGLTRAEAAKTLGELWAKPRAQGEAKWDVKVFVDGPLDEDAPDYEADYLPDGLHDEAEVIAARLREVAAAAAQKANERDAAERRARDLAEFARLAAKLGK